MQVSCILSPASQEWTSSMQSAPSPAEWGRAGVGASSARPKGNRH
jgi:hypothetical protein